MFRASSAILFTAVSITAQHQRAQCKAGSCCSNNNDNNTSTPTTSSVNKYIDHTTLKQTTSEADIKQLCSEAAQHNFAAVCVPPYWITPAREQLKGTDVKVATVIGFPFGYSCISAKVAEVHQAYADHADEVDVVANVSAIKRGDFDYLEREIKEIMKAVRSHKGLVCKVIIESGVLTDEEIIRCCQIYGAAGIDYLKTSTGFAEKGVGASVHAVELFRKHLPPSVQIKASGGIRTITDANAMIAAGATRIGCSAGVAIMKQEKEGIAGNVDNSKAGAY